MNFISSDSIKLLSTKICFVVILFWVNVPVLSEQMIDTQPSPSTDLIFLIIAFSLAIFWVPKASTIVTIELKASGIAATARATANINASNISVCLYTLKPNTIIQIIKMIVASFLLKSSKVIWRGVFFSLVCSIKVAIFPSSVVIPVFVTTIRARP